ncbi:hypothetical protein ABIF44_004255 [Bradyrhizobium japonicum]|nr:hypothetical protein [Bradyrhizobium japonicum]MCS3989443.1 hypothetical protein [Bradyrhizobium japonicum]MCS4015741.1 hypothetical protein [Bradyrhizobium japonicum]MCS4202837.1 hypothetical protein [Bradyrhizobium japonicum]MDH6175513.1 hypothetical protein [Bradyrhizobium japonicum]
MSKYLKTFCIALSFILLGCAMAQAGISPP